MLPRKLITGTHIVAPTTRSEVVENIRAGGAVTFAPFYYGTQGVEELAATEKQSSSQCNRMPYT